MAFDTLGSLITRVEKRISEVAGTSVQIYSEDAFGALIQEGYDFCVKQVWWPHLMVWEKRDLDGVTGRPNTDITTIQTYGDIRAVFTDMSNRPLPELPRDFNPFLSLISNTTAQYIEADNTKSRLFHVWPVTATNTLYIHGRELQSTPFTESDVVNFDALALVNYASWKAVVDDGTNPGQAMAIEATFNKRMAQLIDEYNSKPIQLDPAVNPTMYGWQEFPYG